MSASSALMALLQLRHLRLLGLDQLRSRPAFGSQLAYSE